MSKERVSISTLRKLNELMRDFGIYLNDDEAKRIARVFKDAVERVASENDVRL